MSNLILDSLEIQNFRGLRELRIEHLGRVNLIVGKNNVGKTSVLEALRLYSKPASIDILLSLLESRDEIDVGLDRRLKEREAKPALVGTSQGSRRLAATRLAVVEGLRVRSRGPLACQPIRAATRPARASERLFPRQIAGRVPW